MLYLCGVIIFLILFCHIVNREENQWAINIKKEINEAQIEKSLIKMKEFIDANDFSSCLKYRQNFYFYELAKKKFPDFPMPTLLNYTDRDSNRIEMYLFYKMRQKQRTIFNATLEPDEYDHVAKHTFNLNDDSINGKTAFYYQTKIENVYTLLKYGISSKTIQKALNEIDIVEFRQALKYGTFVSKIHKELGLSYSTDNTPPRGKFYRPYHPIFGYQSY